MKVFKKKGVEETRKELLLISGSSMEDSKIVLHILINKEKGQFIANKVKERNNIEETIWEAVKGYTFPSSIFYEFIKEGN